MMVLMTDGLNKINFLGPVLPWQAEHMEVLSGNVQLHLQKTRASRGSPSWNVWGPAAPIKHASRAGTSICSQKPSQEERP
ncbi:hypothetical protein BaRGS_00006644 [Batillaria attramentaria]|uniref:Uncharacterized protein n=1 Tax=Batillaria attramentaria TaxID=370345 RepID=A0ABD0LRT0_9CAEN